jgi:FSR family fosmidomycin resistance protein-like MFS transporter
MMARFHADMIRDVRIVGVISFGHMLSHFYFLVLPPILPLLKQELHVGWVELGALMSGFALAGGILQTPVGFLVDRFGGRLVVSLGLFVEALCIAAMGFADGFWALMVLYVAAGVANTVFHPGDYAMMAASIPKQRLGRAFSVHLFSGNVGFALAPIVMAGLAVLWDWRAAMILMGAIGMVSAVVMWLQGSLLDADMRARAERIAARAEKAADEAGAAATDAGVRLLTSFPVIMCLMFFILVTLGFSGIKGFFVASLGVLYDTPLATANAALTAFMLSSALGVLVGGMVADKLGVRFATAAFTLVTAGGTVALIGSVPLGAFLLIAITAISGFLQGVLMPTRDLLVREITPDGSMGKVMGFLSSGMMLASGFVPLLFGWVLDNADGRWIFWLCALFISGALLTFTTVRATPHEDAAETAKAA